MSNILVLNSSVLGRLSVSRVLVEEAVGRLAEVDPDATIVHRDLGAAPIPLLTAATVAGVGGEPVTDAELTARTLSKELQRTAGQGHRFPRAVSAPTARLHGAHRCRFHTRRENRSRIGRA
jgi:hypothetical protein